jgi:hypothetical protein
MSTTHQQARQKRTREIIKLLSLDQIKDEFARQGYDPELMVRNRTLRGVRAELYETIEDINGFVGFINRNGGM